MNIKPPNILTLRDMVSIIKSKLKTQPRKLTPPSKNIGYIDESDGYL